MKALCAKLASKRSFGVPAGQSPHSKPVPLYLAVSLALSACARRWAQFRVGLAAWGMESRKESLAIKKIHPGRYNGQIRCWAVPVSLKN